MSFSRGACQFPFAEVSLFDMGLFLSTKRFSGFTCTHRVWNADTHCKYVHGYARSFYFEFAASARSKEGFVMDFGGLKPLQEWLSYTYDHTFLAAEDDPYMQTWKELDQAGQIQLRIVPEVTMEGTARYVHQESSRIIKEQEKGRVWISKVEVTENENNSAIYIPEEES